MKRTLTLVLLLAFCGAAQVLHAQPNITVSPASRTNNIGDNARFTVTAAGTGTVTYQWKFGSGDILDATNSTLNVLVTSITQAGDYSVVVTDDGGPTPSSAATLSLPYANRDKFVQWNFNSNPPDSNVVSGSLLPNAGSGTLASFGGIAVDFTTGAPSDPGEDNSTWRATTWGGATSANKSRGIQLNVDTTGRKDLVLTWEERHQTSASRYVRVQYTINGTDWIDHTVHELTINNVHVFRSSELIGLPGVDNNPLFGIRLTPEWQSTATGGGVESFVGTTATYAGSGNMLIDLITIFATEYTPPNEHPVIVAQPKGQTNYIGSSATFEVAATGGGLHYQWRHEDDDIPGATESSYTVTDLTFAKIGNYSVYITNSVGDVTSDDAYLEVLELPPVGDRFWSGNGSSIGGPGTWSTTSHTWGASAEGPFSLPWINESPVTAFFHVPAGAVAIGEPITVGRIEVVGAANYTFSGGNRLTLTNDSEVQVGTAQVTFTAPLGGDIITKMGSGRMHLNNTASEFNSLKATEGIISVQNGTSLGAAPAELVPDRIVLDGAGLGFEGVAPSLSATRGMYLGLGGGRLAVRPGGVVLTIHAPITGPGGISFPGYSAFHSSGVYGAPNERFVFNNPGNNYAGATTITVSELRLGADEVLPDTTSVILNGSSGRLNLNGWTETVTSVVLSGTGGYIQDLVGGGSLTVTDMIDLRATGNTGVAVPVNGSAFLRKSTPGVATISGANTYSGDTFLDEGEVILRGPGSFGNGAGTLFIVGTNAAGSQSAAVIIRTADTRTESTILMNPVFASNPTLLAEFMADASSSNEVVFLSGGEWNIESGHLYVGNGSTTEGTTFTLGLTNSALFGEPAILDLYPLTVQLASLNHEGTEQVFNGVIQGQGSFRRSVLSGTGGTTIFNAANSYSGGTMIEAGTLIVASPSGSGTGSGSVSVGGQNGMLAGNGIVGGAVTVTTGGSISAGSNVGILTLQGGLSLSGGGRNVWDLGVLADNAGGTPGTDFDQLVLSAGDLQLGGSSGLVLRFAPGVAPNSTVPFWQSPRTWTIINLTGGQNAGNTTFASVVNEIYNAGTFSTSVDGSGNVMLQFTPSAPSGAQVAANPQSRTNIVGTTATFTVVATGSDPLTYSWFRSDAPFIAIPDATNATFTIVNVQPSNAGDYFARVSNLLGNDTSQTATLAIAPQPQISSPTVVDGNVTMSWGTVPGVSYQGQYTADLASGSWTTFTNVVASGSSFTVTDTPPPGGPQRFYRLLIQ